MRYKVYTDEWWPVYSVTDYEGGIGLAGEIELTEAEMADYKRVAEEFDTWQNRLEKECNRDEPLRNPRR